MKNQPREIQEGIGEGEIPLLLGIDISSAFDCLNRPKLLRQLRATGFGQSAIKLIQSYFTNRTQQVDIGGKRGEKRPADIGVLQGSGMSPLFFLTYFLRGSIAVRTCNICKTKLRNQTEGREERCEICGKTVTYADDATAVHRSKGRMKEIKEKSESQGSLIEATLNKLGLVMNKIRTQFLIVMSYQRKYPSRKIESIRREYDTKLTIDISNSKIEQKEDLKILGVYFDDQTNFQKHWEKTNKACWNRIFAISNLGRHIPVKKRRELGQGLVVSKISYCLEATSTGPRSVMKGPNRALNKCVRS